jgi:hypothetical protein
VSPETFYLYTHNLSVLGRDFAASFTVASSSTQSFGTIAAFPCPSNLTDITQSYNVCQANASESGYMVDQTKNPLDLVGIINPTLSVSMQSAYEGIPLKAAFARADEEWSDHKDAATRALSTSHKPHERVKRDLVRLV